MKKILLGIVIFIVIGIFPSCSSGSIVNNNTKSNLDSTQKIGFKYFFRGFITLRDNQIEQYPKDTLIIKTDEDWHNFMDKYVPGIPYDLAVNYDKECLLFTDVFPAKPFFSIGTDIKDFILSDNKIEPEYVDNGHKGIANGIYAQNIYDIMHCFVNIVMVEKKEIPKNAVNVYHS